MLDRGSSRARRPLVVLALATCVLATAAACGGSTSSGSGAGSGGGPGGGDAPATTTPPQLFDSDFRSVCQGASQSRATAYDAAAATHKVLYFETYKDSLVQSESKLPSDWQVTFDANCDAFAETDLVACAVRTGDTFVKDCTGYQKDGVDTGNVAKLHSATYELTVHEATTGKTLDTTTIDAPASDCPMFVSFESDADTVLYYETPSEDEVVAFLKPHAQPDQPAG